MIPDSGLVRWVERLVQDLRHGARLLAKHPGFTLIATLSIAIGVGANAAMFSYADGVILRPLAVPDAICWRRDVSFQAAVRDDGYELSQRAGEPIRCDDPLLLATQADCHQLLEVSPDHRATTVVLAGVADVTCPFCSYVDGRFTRDLIVYEDDDVLVVPCKGQKHSNHGHCIVATRAHIRDIYELPHSLAGAILRTVSVAARTAKRTFSADGVSVRQNNDAASGQDVFHLHFHIVPRFLGDDFDTAPYETVDERIRIDQAEALRRLWMP